MNYRKFYLQHLPLALPSMRSVFSDDKFVSPGSDDFSPVKPHSSTSVEPGVSFEYVEANVSEPNTTNGSTDLPLRRSSRMSKQPVWLSNYKTDLPQESYISYTVSHMVQSDFGYFLAASTTSADSVHFSQVVQHIHWITAMNTELEALERNGTWDIVHFPPGKNAIGSEWMYKTRYKSDGTIE